DGSSGCGQDCNDADPRVYPGAPQICDGLNNDCNAVGWPSLAGTNEQDNDGDGISECHGDCDDSRATVYPGAPGINDGRANQGPGAPGYGVRDEISGPAGFDSAAAPLEFCWMPQAGALRYLVDRADDARFTAGCQRYRTTSTSCVQDADDPPAGSVF